ncbi:MAG: hypothetical protein ACTHK7_22865 [Aureliella sp.]
MPAANSDLNPASARSSAPRPATISGRRMTVVVLITLLATGLLFYWVTTSYGTYNAARRQTDRTWRALAAVLDERYQQYDARLAQALAEKQIDAATEQRWKETRDSFSRTTLAGHQVEAAQTLEAAIAQLPPALRLPEDDSPELHKLTGDYAAAVATQRQVGQTAGSRMLKLMLSLPEPPEFKLAE